MCIFRDAFICLFEHKNSFSIKLFPPWIFLLRKTEKSRNKTAECLAHLPPSIFLLISCQEWPPFWGTTFIPPWISFEFCLSLFISRYVTRSFFCGCNFLVSMIGYLTHYKTNVIFTILRIYTVRKVAVRTSDRFANEIL